MHIEGRLGLDENDDGEPTNEAEYYAFGFIYARVRSFTDARPRGASEMHFEEADDWAAGDMLRHLRFERGELHFYADYVRGRCMKTTVIARADVTFMLDAVNRGEAATRWIAKLQGKKLLRAINDADA